MQKTSIVIYLLFLILLLIPMNYVSAADPVSNSQDNTVNNSFDEEESKSKMEENSPRDTGRGSLRLARGTVGAARMAGGAPSRGAGDW